MNKIATALCIVFIMTLCSCAAHYEAKTKLHEARARVIIAETELRKVEAKTPLSKAVFIGGSFTTYRQSIGHVGELKEASSMASGIAEVGNTAVGKILAGGIAAGIAFKQVTGDVDTNGGAYTSNSGNTNSIDTVDVNGEDGTTLDQSNKTTDSHDVNNSNNATASPAIVETKVVIVPTKIVEPKVVNPEIIYPPVAAGE